jgi:hypothetical protein
MVIGYHFFRVYSASYQELGSGGIHQTSFDVSHPISSPSIFSASWISSRLAAIGDLKKNGYA